MRAVLQGELGLAYVQAVASAAGYGLDKTGAVVDADGIDAVIVARGLRAVIRSPRLEVQVKTTAGIVSVDPIPYDLAVKNYDELRDIAWQIPRILVLVVVPGDPSEWLAQSEAELAMRRCGYWLSLRGAAQSANVASVRVPIPRAQIFDVNGLRGLMDRVAAREDL